MRNTVREQFADDVNGSCVTGGDIERTISAGDGLRLIS